MRKLALALTWDGTLWPRRRLPRAAHQFLALTGQRPPRRLNPQQAGRLLRNGEVEEVRICWIPRLKGGSGTLMFGTPNLASRFSLRPVKTARLGDCLGVVYRA